MIPHTVFFFSINDFFFYLSWYAMYDCVIPSMCFVLHNSEEIKSNYRMDSLIWRYEQPETTVWWAPGRRS